MNFQYGHPKDKINICSTRGAEKLNVYRQVFDDIGMTRGGYEALYFIEKFFNGLMQRPEFISIKSIQRYQSPKEHGDIVELHYSTLNPMDIIFDKQLDEHLKSALAKISTLNYENDGYMMALDRRTQEKIALQDKVDSHKHHVTALWLTIATLVIAMLFGIHV